MDFGHLHDYIGAVISQWASLATGGIIMGIIALIESIREKPIPKKLMLGVFLLFLLVAFYKAWDEQYRESKAADASNEAALHQSHELLTTIGMDRRTIDEQSGTIGRLTADLYDRTNIYVQKAYLQETNSVGWLPPELPEGCSNVTVSFGMNRMDVPVWVAKLPHLDADNTNAYGTNNFTCQVSPNLSMTFYYRGDAEDNVGAITYQLTDLPYEVVSNIENMPDFPRRKRTMSFGSVGHGKTQMPNGKSIDMRAWPLVVSNRLFVDVIIPSINKRHIIVMDTNMDGLLTNLPIKWEYNWNSNKFEIVNEDKNPVLQVIYKSPSEVQVNGLYVISKFGFYAAFDSPPFSSKLFVGLNMIPGQQSTQFMDLEDVEKVYKNVTITTDSNVLYGTKFSFAKTIFKYPAWQHLHEETISGSGDKSHQRF